MAYQSVAQHFGDLIACGDYSAAWRLLAKELQSITTPDAIKTSVERMIAYASGPILQARVMEDGTVENWPSKQATDLAVVYVALNGESFSEAVVLTLAQYGEGALIRQLEWGRP
jgi:hypothetical protein